MPPRSPSPPWSPLLLRPAADPSSSAASSEHQAGGHGASDGNHHGCLAIPSLRMSSSDCFSGGDVHYRLLSSLPSHPKRSASTSLAVSPSGNLLYSASHSGVAVYDLETFRLVEAFPAAVDGAVKALAFSADGHVLTAHQDSRIRVWKIPPPPPTTAANGTSAAKVDESRLCRHRLLATLPTVTDRLRRFALPGNYVTVRRHKKRLWIEHADAVAGLAVGDTFLYSVSWDKTIKVWSTADLRCLQSLPAHDDAINAIAVSRDGTIYTGSADCRIRVWHQTVPNNLRKGRRSRHRYALVSTLERHRSAVNTLALSADGGLLCSGACDRSILVWEKAGATAGDMAVAGTITGHERAIMCLAMAGELLVSGSTDRTVRVWRRIPGAEYRCLAVMEGHAGGVRSLAVLRAGGEKSSPLEYMVCSGASDGEVRVWQLSVCSFACGGGENDDGTEPDS